ncbi:MAG: hypothetical protein JWM11_431 [Planctomycetaceae bacterium]|nr:hypothetical protein [Planctomycetaceae bacterium]
MKTLDLRHDWVKIKMHDRRNICRGPVSRRSVLQAGSLLLGGLGLGDLYRLRAQAESVRPNGENNAVILVWLEGGPSQLETYDMKPRAPAEYRGEFLPIETVVPGLDVCELLPLHTKIADKFNLIRSISHDVADHPGAAGRFLTGRRPQNISDPVSKFPTVESIVAKSRENRHVGIPNYISNERRLKGGGSAYLGQAGEPFVVSADPNSGQFQVQDLTLDEQFAGRLDDRVTLLRGLDRLREGLDRAAGGASNDRFQQQALDLLTSDKTAAAFDIRRESMSTRDRYGRNEWGQRALLARRLVEAGCSFVTVQMQKMGASVTWDDHGDGGSIPTLMRARLPAFDQAISALIADVYERGLDKQVMIVVAGEFGRAPLLTYRPKSRAPGRDHWPSAMSVLVSGGGMRTGQVIGTTNAKAEFPIDRPHDPNDLLASIYHFLGIDLQQTYPDLRGRPMPILPTGKPIPELS